MKIIILHYVELKLKSYIQDDKTKLVYLNRDILN